jgi:non-canonical (house-cleaning) NTP pyrophosphatase
MKLGTVVGVSEDSPLLVECGEVVVSDKVGDGHARVFGLLEAVAEGVHDDRAVGEVVNVVHQVDDAGDAVKLTTCVVGRTEGGRAKKISQIRTKGV